MESHDGTVEPPPKKSRSGSKAIIKAEPSVVPVQEPEPVPVPKEATDAVPAEADDAAAAREKAAKLLQDKVDELKKEASLAKALSDRMTKELKLVDVARARLLGPPFHITDGTGVIKTLTDQAATHKLAADELTRLWAEATVSSGHLELEMVTAMHASLKTRHDEASTSYTVFVRDVLGEITKLK